MSLALADFGFDFFVLYAWLIFTMKLQLHPAPLLLRAGDSSMQVPVAAAVQTHPIYSNLAFLHCCCHMAIPHFTTARSVLSTTQIVLNFRSTTTMVLLWKKQVRPAMMDMP